MACEFQEGGRRRRFTSATVECTDGRDIGAAHIVPLPHGVGLSVVDAETLEILLLPWASILRVRIVPRR